MAEYADKAGLKVCLQKLKTYIDNKADDVKMSALYSSTTSHFYVGTIEYGSIAEHTINKFPCAIITGPFKSEVNTPTVYGVSSVGLITKLTNAVIGTSCSQINCSADFDANTVTLRISNTSTGDIGYCITYLTNSEG